MVDIFYPFDWLASQLVIHLFQLPLASRWGSSLHFFFYDVPKVLTLLAVISFAVIYLQSYVSPEKVRNFLEGQKTLFAHLLAGFLGAITPFCSCSAVPLFIGFLKAGVPLGVTFSYLIAAPMVDAVAVFLLWNLFGLQATLLYILFGVALATVAGYVMGVLSLEGWVEPFVLQGRQQPTPVVADCQDCQTSPSQKQRLEQAWLQAAEILRSVWLYVVIGIAIGAGIHGYAPVEVISRWAGPGNPFAVPISTLIGVPLYTNIAGVLPIAKALVSKGMALGTVLAFTMAVTALSLPQMIILKKVMRLPLLGIFIGLTTLGIMAVGYLFNGVFNGVMG